MVRTTGTTSTVQFLLCEEKRESIWGHGKTEEGKKKGMKKIENYICCYGLVGGTAVIEN